MGRHANPDIRRAFAEYQDQDTPSKCNKVRCLHCGYVRAKNTTRQIEHLQECQPYLASPDAQAHLQQQITQATLNGSAGDASGPPTSASSQILSGPAPNPNLQVHRRGPNTKRDRNGQSIAPSLPVRPQHAAPSLTAHLLALHSSIITQATEQPFLSHAGCGSLAAGPLSQWLVQDGHYSRGYIRFVGQLLAKIRLPQTSNSQFHPMYRTMDLLISALNNRRREMQFSEITATKYGLVLGGEGPTPIARALLDLFVSASSSSASLLEGMVVLWGTEHIYRTAWQYAASFNNALTNPSADSHIVALHQAFIPNWTSHAFHKFIEAARALVDELANITTRDGKEEMQRCEEIFKQVCWLEERFWPTVNGMGEDSDTTRDSTGFNPINRNMNNSTGNTTFNGPTMGPQINGSLSNAIPNNSMSSQIASRMSGQISGQPMSSAPLNGENMNGDNGGTPTTNARTSFTLNAVDQMTQMAQPAQ